MTERWRTRNWKAFGLEMKQVPRLLLHTQKWLIQWKIWGWNNNWNTRKVLIIKFRSSKSTGLVEIWLKLKRAWTDKTYSPTNTKMRQIMQCCLVFHQKRTSWILKSIQKSKNPKQSLLLLTSKKDSNNMDLASERQVLQQWKVVCWDTVICIPKVWLRFQKPQFSSKQVLSIAKGKQWTQ